jgi:hypothetical protein
MKDILHLRKCSIMKGAAYKVIKPGYGYSENDYYEEIPEEPTFGDKVYALDKKGPEPMTGTNSDGSAEENSGAVIAKLKKELQEAKEALEKHKSDRRFHICMENVQAKNINELEAKIEQLQAQSLRQASTIGDKAHEIEQLKEQIRLLNKSASDLIENEGGEADRVYEVMRENCNDYRDNGLCDNSLGPNDCATHRQDCPLFAAKKEDPDRIETGKIVWGEMKPSEMPFVPIKELTKGIKSKYAVVLERINKPE